MAVNARGNGTLHDKPSQLLLQPANGRVEGRGHGVEVDGDEGAEVLDQRLVADLLVQGLQGEVLAGAGSSSARPAPPPPAQEERGGARGCCSTSRRTAGRRRSAR